MEFATILHHHSMPVFFAFQPVCMIPSNTPQSVLKLKKLFTTSPVQINLQFEWFLMNLQSEKVDTKLLFFSGFITFTMLLSD